MLRLEARAPFSGAAANAYFGRNGSNYLMEPIGLTAALRSQLASAAVPLERTDVANPYIQVFKKNGIFSDTWTLQVTGWINSASPLPLGDIQNRWTNAIVQALIQSGLQMSPSEIRAAIDQGFSKYAPERLRTASGAPNFSPLDNPGNGNSLWFSNGGASGSFITPTPLPTPTVHPEGNTTTNTEWNTPVHPASPSTEEAPKRSYAIPLLLVVAGVGVLMVLGKDE